MGLTAKQFWPPREADVKAGATQLFFSSHHSHLERTSSMLLEERIRCSRLRCMAIKMASNVPPQINADEDGRWALSPDPWLALTSDSLGFLQDALTLLENYFEGRHLRMTLQLPLIPKAGARLSIGLGQSCVYTLSLVRTAGPRSAFWKSNPNSRLG